MIRMTGYQPLSDDVWLESYQILVDARPPQMGPVLYGQREIGPTVVGLMKLHDGNVLCGRRAPTDRERSYWARIGAHEARERYEARRRKAKH